MMPSQYLGLESHLIGSGEVSVRAEPLSVVVFTHNRITRLSSLGYFSLGNSRRGFDSMQLPVGSDGDVERLEARLFGVTQRQKNSAENAQLVQMEEALDYFKAILESQGLSEIAVRYLKGGKLFKVNMNKGTIRMRNLPEPVPYTPNEETGLDNPAWYDPRDPPRGYDPPEVDEVRMHLR